MSVPDVPPGFDFTDPEIYTTRVPAEELAELRRAAPVWWVTQRRGSAGFDDEGYWAVTRHADVMAVSKTPDVYSSEENTALIRFKEGMPRESIEMQRIILLNMDPPQHTKLRGIVSRGFTPRAIGNLRQALTERAQRIVATALESGTGEFVADVASELPLQAISELIGVPQEDRGKIFSWSNRMIGYDDQAPGEENDGEMAAAEILGYSMAMAEERRGYPRDDIVTKLISAEIDGHGLSDDEFGFFVLMLAVAGNETTRNAIAHGMLAFLDHPGQWELFKASRPDTTADEIVRWATPITVFQRTATRDVELAGRRSRRASGWGSSTGRPTSTRRSSTTPGGSTSAAARTRTSATAATARTTAWAPAWPSWRSSSSSTPSPTPCRISPRPANPVRLRSGWINGIKRLPVTYRP